MVSFFIMNLSRPLSGVYSSFFLFDYNCQILAVVNDGRKQTGNKKKNWRVCLVLLHFILKKSNAQQEKIEGDSELKKSPSATWDSSPACPDRMPSLYHLCHHHFHSPSQLKLVYLHRGRVLPSQRPKHRLLLNSRWDEPDFSEPKPSPNFWRSRSSSMKPMSSVQALNK